MYLWSQQYKQRYLNLHLNFGCIGWQCNNITNQLLSFYKYLICYFKILAFKIFENI